MNHSMLTSNLEGVEFRGEGNSGIVVALKNSKHVLKLKKTSLTNENIWSEKDWLALHQYQVAFTRTVAVPILGPSLIDVPGLACLCRNDIMFLSTSVRKQRASHRLRKAVSPALSCGLLFRDHCVIDSPEIKRFILGPVICIELKTKMGFMPFSFPSELQLKSKICRFHLVQNQKFRQNRIGNISDYCPLDLYSGCKNRMESAILKLLRNPQNNLRIFRDRTLIFGGEKTSSKLSLGDFLNSTTPNLETEQRDLTNLVLLALLMPLFEDRCHEAQTASTEIETRPCMYSSECSCDNEESHKLPKSCVLNRLLLCQQLCLEDVSTLYTLFSTKPAAKNQFFQSGYPKAEIPVHLFSKDRQPEESIDEYEHRVLWKCLVALTCRDSSIMITMQKVSDDWKGNINSPNLNILEYNDQHFIVSMGIIDLEPKSLDRIPKQLQDDLSMINNFEAEA